VNGGSDENSLEPRGGISRGVCVSAKLLPCQPSTMRSLKRPRQLNPNRCAGSAGLGAAFADPTTSTGRWRSTPRGLTSVLVLTGASIVLGTDITGASIARGTDITGGFIAPGTVGGGERPQS
jgi:hypothetical protein